MNKRGFRIIMVLQVAFLVGAFAFGIGTAYQNAQMHSPTTTLEVIRAAFKTDHLDAARLQDRTSVDAQTMLAAEAVKAGKEPADVLAVLGEGVYLAGIDTREKGKGAIVVAQNQLGTVPDGVIYQPGITAQVGGVHVYRVDSRGAVDALVGKSSAAGMAVTEPVSLPNQPYAGAVANVFDVLRQNLGRELVVVPATEASRARGWLRALETLEFTQPAIVQGEKVSSINATITTFGESELAIQYADQTAIAAYEDIAAVFLYPRIAATPEVAAYLEQEGLNYALGAIRPGTVGREAREFIKTKGEYVTRPVAIRALTVPIIISVNVPEGITAVPAESRELLTEPVYDYAFLLEPRQTVIIPAGAGYSISNPSLKYPAFFEAVSAKGLEILEAPTPYTTRRGAAHRIMATEAGVAIERNPAYAEIAKAAEPALATARNIPVLGLTSTGPSLYETISRQGLEAKKLAAFLTKGYLTYEEAVEDIETGLLSSAEISFLTNRGHLAEITVELYTQRASSILGVRSVEVRAAAAGEAIRVFKPASPEVVTAVFAEINKNLGTFNIVTPAKAESWQEAFSGALEVTEPIYQSGLEDLTPGAFGTMLSDLALREQFKEQAALQTPQAAETVSSITFANLAPNEATSEFLEEVTTEAGITVLLPLTVAGELNQTQGEYLSTPLAMRLLTGKVFVALYKHYESKQPGAQPFLVPSALTHENREVVSWQLLYEKPVEVSLVALGPGEALIIPGGVGYKAYNVTPEGKPAAYEYARSTAGQLVDIDTPFTEYGPAHRITTTESGAVEITLNPKYADIITSETPILAAAFDIPVLDLIAREGPSITEILNRGDGVAKNLVALLQNGQLTTEQVMQGRPVAPSTGTPEVRFLTNRGELPVVEIASAQEALGVPVEIKAASAGEALVQLQPTQVELMDIKGTTLGKADTSTPWDFEVLKKIEALNLAGALLAEMPENAEAAREQMRQVIEELAGKAPSVELGKIATAAEEKSFVVPSSDQKLERVLVPISKTQVVAVELPAGTYQPVMAEREVPAALTGIRAERGAIVIDYNALGVQGTRKDGRAVYIPNDYVMRAIAILNALKDQQIDGRPRYHVAVYSDNVTTEVMQNNLGALAASFDGFVQAPTVAEAISQIAQEQQIEQERFTVSIAQSTIERNPNVLDGFAKLAKAVNMVMVMTPQVGQYVSYKAILLNSLKLLEGVIAPGEINQLRGAIEGASEIRGLTVEPEEDTDKAVSRMQAAISV